MSTLESNNKKIIHNKKRIWGGVVSVVNPDELHEQLRENFPLAGQLRFTSTAGGQPEELPTIISLLSSMTNPDLEGDTCILLPSRKNVAFLVAVIASLTANREHYPDRLEKYISEGFQIGDRVRILPNGEVYIFEGYHEEEYGRLFKLSFLDDNSNSSRAFPIEKAVRLEKTNASRPKGRGEGWGTAHLSKLDIILGTNTYGNHCLFSNEIMLVGTKKEFLEFLDSVHVSRPENEEFSIPLSEIIPWGVVKMDGSIEFGNYAAASGQPIIAISPRLEYIAAACRTNQEISPRVIIDGASRVKDLQAFDDVVEFSKLLVVADHSQAEQLGELASRDCTVWKLPDEVEDIVGSGSSLLENFQEKYRLAKGFSLASIHCESEFVDEIATCLVRAEKILREEDADEAVFKILSIAYARLLDFSAILHTPAINEFEKVRESIDSAARMVEQQRNWISNEACALLLQAFTGISEGLSPDGAEYRRSKQVRFLEEIEAMKETAGGFAIVCQSNIAASSARSFLSENGLEGILVQTIPEHLSGKIFGEILLTGWPRSKNLLRLADAYNAGKISALSFGFEHRWFTRTAERRGRSLSRWRGDVGLFKSLTGLEGTISIDPDPPYDETGGNAGLFGDVEELETSVSLIKKGTKADTVDQVETRDAKYIGFEGKSYAYLTPDRKVPKITDIVTGSGGADEKASFASVDGLQTGDYVLWRAHTDSDKDMVRLIAEQGMPEGEYEVLREKAGRWKRCLNSIAPDQKEVWQKLKEAGLTKIEATVSNWLFYEDLIGPGEEEDLYIIAKAAGHSDFKEAIPETWGAIKKVRSAHMEAGYKLSQLLFKNLPGQLPELNDTGTLVDLILDEVSIGAVWILQVEMIEEEFEKRPHWDVNRLLWDEI